MSGRAETEQVGQVLVARLESQAMDQYLNMLQDISYAYVQLKSVEPAYFINGTNRIIPNLKSELNKAVFGVELRQDMINKVLSGKYPTEKYRTRYGHSTASSTDTYMGSYYDLKVERNGSSKCSSVCCTGAYIVETMLSVIMNLDVRQLRFPHARHCQTVLCKKPGDEALVPLNIALILEHYKRCLNERLSVTESKTRALVPQLRYLRICETISPHLQSRNGYALDLYYEAQR